MNDHQNLTERDLNEDPLSGEHGAHPVGAGVGTAVGGTAAGLAGAAIGGPIGAAVGIVAGGVAGGLAGKEIAEQIDPTVEEAYWRDEYPNREYYDPTVGYPEVGPAYRYGWESRLRHRDRSWEEAEPSLESNWPSERGESPLEWHKARPAAHDARTRIDDTGISLDDERNCPPRVPK